MFYTASQLCWSRGCNKMATEPKSVLWLQLDAMVAPKKITCCRFKDQAINWLIKTGNNHQLQTYKHKEKVLLLWLLAVKYILVHWFMMAVELLTRTMSEMSCYVILMDTCQHILPWILGCVFQVENLWNENVDLTPNIGMMCILVRSSRTQLGCSSHPLYQVQMASMGMRLIMSTSPRLIIILY